MTPRVAIVVRGGVVQEVASDTADVLIKLLDVDSIAEGDSPSDCSRRIPSSANHKL